jgi:hypothetical protein
MEYWQTSITVVYTLQVAYPAVLARACNVAEWNIGVCYRHNAAYFTVILWKISKREVVCVVFWKRVMVKLSLSARLCHLRGEEVRLHSFLIWALDGDEWRTSCHLPSVKKSGTHWTGGWVGPKGGPGDLEKTQICFPSAMSKWEYSDDKVDKFSTF